MATENFLTEHGGKLFYTTMGGLLLAMTRWIIGREVARIDSKARDHEERLRELESTVVTKDDLRELRDTMTKQHGQLLDAILMQNTGGR